MAQMGFFDLSDRCARLDARRDPLVEIDSLVPREEFRPALQRVRRKPEAARKSRAGRKPMDAVVMFKTLVPGALCTLSDDRLRGARPAVLHGKSHCGTMNHVNMDRRHKLIRRYHVNDAALHG